MQAQAVRNETVQGVLTLQQSLQSVQTLLKAGLGCITYLRNLLPADNFSESYLTSSHSALSRDCPSEAHGSFASDSSGRNVSGFKIMTVMRGYTEEADKLLDFLEKGIFDALQRQYLRSFIFAIYLDGDDPNNIVEAYTFNFHYHSIPGTEGLVPVMTLGEDLMKMSISGAPKQADPIVEAVAKGRVPTLGEVKRSLKALIKNLIQATTQMDPLPRRRFATFKLFYHDNTPDDYEPPLFRVGDIEKDKWFFTTHSREEIPEKCSVGVLNSGWHGVDVHVASVSGYLPSVEDNSAPFLGTTTGCGPMALALTPAEEVTARAQQTEVQRLDAMERRVVWNAESCLANPHNETGIRCESTPAATKQGANFTIPIGVRDELGNILPLPEPYSPGCAETSSGRKVPHLKEGHYIGAQEDVPSRVGQLALSIPRPDHLEETQQLEYPDGPRPLSLVPSTPSLTPLSPSSTPRPAVKQVHPLKSQFASQSLPPSDVSSFSIPSVSSINPPTLDTQGLIQLMRGTDNQDAEMLDLETQAIPSNPPDDPIESFSSTGETKQRELSPVSDAPMKDAVGQDGILDCECAVTLEDNDLIFCDGGCNKWFHVWCMGYHTIRQVQGDATFVCFDCRVRADQHWDLILLHDLYPTIMQRFRDLALFRRGIKIYERNNPPNLSAFIKLIGCENIVAGQVFRRLESEGFIARESREQDELGLMETSTRKPRGKNKGSCKTRQSIRLQGQKAIHVFLEASKKTQAYADFFSPDPQVEKRILDLSDLRPKRKAQTQSKETLPKQANMKNTSAMNGADHRPAESVPGAHESQTQEELPSLMFGTTMGTDSPLLRPVDKRKNSDPGTARNTKRVKISVGPGVDLGD